MKYKEPALMSQEAADTAINTGSSEDAAKAVISVAIHEPSREWAEEFSLKALKDARRDVLAAAIISVGHLARRFKRVSPVLLSALRDLNKSEDVAGIVDDVFDDVLLFVDAEK